uniref:Homoserine kinase n=1 Tax=Oryza brachyantha TaxID=4533 RepID=J3LIR4_ORYBR
MAMSIPEVIVAIAISYGHFLEKPTLPAFVTFLMQFLNFSWHFTLIRPATKKRMKIKKRGSERDDKGNKETTGVWSWSRQQASRSSQGSSPSQPLQPTPQYLPYRIPTAAEKGGRSDSDGEMPDRSNQLDAQSQLRAAHEWLHGGGGGEVAEARTTAARKTTRRSGDLGGGIVKIGIGNGMGLPLGSGLGSSAASAAAAAKAVDALFGSRLHQDDLVLAGLESEKAVSGFHADNIAPAILGGFVLVRSYDPFHLIPLSSPPALRLHFVLVTPDFEAPTSKMRAALPKQVAVQQHVRNSSQAAALVAAVLQGDAGVIGSAMSSDGIVEPTRAPLIPGMAAVKAAALEAGALGCTISGAGPTAVAVIEGEEKGEEVGQRMVEAFASAGKLKATATIAQLDRVGARVISTSSLE